MTQPFELVRRDTPPNRYEQTFARLANKTPSVYDFPFSSASRTRCITVSLLCTRPRYIVSRERTIATSGYFGACMDNRGPGVINQVAAKR